MSDVVIVGGGPVGLFLACELRLAGVSVLVLEQAEDPRSPLKRLPFGMRGLSAPTLDALDRRGLLDDIGAAQRREDDAGGFEAAAHWRQQPRQAGGHFAGIPFHHDRIDTAAWPYRLPGSARASLAVTIETLETVLAARAGALGVEIRRGVRVEALELSDRDVTLRAGRETFRAAWLVGCDGGRSRIRKTAGFEVVGTDPEFTGYSLLVELADPHGLRPGRHATPTGMYTFAAPGTIAMVAFDGGALHRAGPVTRDHAQAVLRHVSGTDVTLAALSLATTWTDRAFQATRYRRGRVLLAGDAAHIHSPLGGQGLNLGLGDAINLGWKLAATIRGDAPAGLLDSYTDERHPLGAQVLDWSRAQVALMRPSPSSRALAAILRDLIATPDGATYVAGRVWGVSLRTDLGDPHPLVGRSVPDFALADGTTVGQRLRHGTGLLLDFDGSAPLAAVARRFGDRVAYVAGETPDRLGLGAILVRPDGVVAWAGEGTPDAEEVARAASRWFGEGGAG